MNKHKILVKHFRSKCIGCGQCALDAPENWAMSQKDGKALLKGSKPIKNFYQGEVDFDQLEDNKKASKNCPVNIIKIDN